MNIELLERIAAHIEAHPDEFDMGAWCGTSCCIAGHACVMSGKVVDHRTAKGVAMKLLGITCEQAVRLFIAGPERYDVKMWEGATSTVRAKAAASRIKHFIATGGRE